MTRTGTFLAASLLALSVGAAAARAEGTLNVVSWGGQYAKSQIEAYHKPFAAKTGATVNSIDYNGGLAEVRAQHEANNVTWDIIDVELSDAVLGCQEGLFEEIDTSILPPGADGTPALKDFIDGTLADCGVATIIFSTVFAYDTTKFPDAKPASWADFFDVEKFPGKRGMKRQAKANLEFALMADGVPPAEVYEVLATDEGVKRAFAKLDSIKDHIVWWEAGAQAPQLLADGEVVMTTAWNGRIYGAMVEEKKPFEIVWDGQIWDIDLWAILSGAPNKERAKEFLVFSTGTEPLARQSDWISYGPARKSSMASVSPDVLPHLPTAEANFETAVQADYEFWSDNADELNERFAAWLAAS